MEGVQEEDNMNIMADMWIATKSYLRVSSPVQIDKTSCFTNRKTGMPPMHQVQFVS